MIKLILFLLFMTTFFVIAIILNNGMSHNTEGVDKIVESVGKL